MNNLATFRSSESDVTIIEQDFRKIEYDNIGKFNILFYDGSHEEVDQHDGILLPQPAMEDTHIY